MTVSDFDRNVAENDIPPERIGEAFADWLAQQTGQPITGGPAGEPPTVVAVPDDSDLERLSALCPAFP